MEAVLIGYCAKKVEKRPEWLKVPNVELVCSVSNCVSSGPEGTKDYHPDRNPMWLYANEGAAHASIQPPERAVDFDIFAYKLLPVAFGDEGEQLDLDPDGEQAAFDAASSAVEPLPPNYERLGFDCPGKTTDWPYSGFDCSPLSCNSMAEEIEVNRYCLIEDKRLALEVASHFGIEQPEPGNYYVVEVWRKRRGPPSP
jgi:hypothetical protein